MWSALRTDLTEFVSTVTGDTAEALNQIDASFPENNKGDDEGDEESSPAEEEALRRMALEETYTTPLIPGKEAKTEKDDEEKEKAEGDEANVGEEDDEDDDVPEDLKEFVASFSIESKTDEIALLLDVHPHTVKVHFEKLVPTTVKYDDFWMRFFYRCDSDRIKAEWDAEEAAAKKARAQAVQQGLSTVRNLFGGAVKAVSSSLGEGETGKQSGFKVTANQAREAASGYFKTGGRPPFVMNTAVSEDDFDGEEEEELGWDDDDEDEDYDPQADEANEESVDTEQIEFNDAVTEKLQEDLKQAVAERDSLQQTVELLHKEIASLKNTAGTSEEVEKLKTQLFEKDSEIAAMRASLLDSSRTDDNDAPDPKVSLLENEIKRLSSKMDEAGAVAQKQLDEKAEEIEKLSKALGEANEKTSSAKKEAEEWKNKTMRIESENSNLKKSLDAAKESASNVEELAAEVSSLREELDKVKAALASAEKSKEEVVAELQKANESLHANEEAAKLEEEDKSVDSPDTMSTGIKIEPPAVEKLDEEAAFEDGWDDEW